MAKEKYIVTTLDYGESTVNVCGSIEEVVIALKNLVSSRWITADLEALNTKVYKVTEEIGFHDLIKRIR